MNGSGCVCVSKKYHDFHYLYCFSKTIQYQYEELSKYADEASWLLGSSEAETRPYLTHKVHLFTWFMAPRHTHNQAHSFLPKIICHAFTCCSLLEGRQKSRLILAGVVSVTGWTHAMLTGSCWVPAGNDFKMQIIERPVWPNGGLSSLITRVLTNGLVPLLWHADGGQSH